MSNTFGDSIWEIRLQKTPNTEIEIASDRAKELEK